MKRRRDPESAAEVMARLHKDPEWVRAHNVREAELREKEARFRAEELPIVEDLAAVGCVVDSVWDLVNTAAPYAAAVPVLCRHLVREYHPRILEGIARALTVDEARGAAAGVLLEELERRGDSPGELRWALANALTVAADRGMADRIRSLLADPRFGDVHERLAVALKRAVGRRDA